MQPSSFKRHPLAIALSSLLSSAVLAPTVHAYELVWDGSGDSDSWFYANNNLLNPNTNWTNNDVVPTAGDSLVFDGNTRLTPDNDAAPGFVVGGISFAPSAGAFTLSGNAITSAGNISNLSSKLQTINLPIAIGIDQTWDGGTAGMAVNGAVTLGDHSLSLSNKTAINNSNVDFVVGDSGTANLVLQSGSTLRNQTGIVGNQLNGQGSVTVTGSNSLWENSVDLIVGKSGKGSLNIENGGKVSDSSGLIGFNPSSNATVTVTGANSLWANSGAVDIGNDGVGTLIVQDGGHVNSTFGILGSQRGIGTATIGGADSVWTDGGNLLVGNNGKGSLNIENGGKVSNASGFLGLSQSGTGVATVKGTNSLWENSGELLVGNNGKGSLNIENGGKVTDLNGLMGSFAGSSGIVTVTGANSLWENAVDLQVGGIGNDGQGTLNIENNGEVSVGNTLSIGNQGILNLNGGTLSVKTPDITPSAGGQFNWLSGTLNITGSNGVSLGNNPMLGAVTSLTAGKTLAVVNTLSVNDGNFLLLNGGQVKAGTLALTGGSIAANSTTSLNMNDIGMLNGYGTVAAAISGGSAKNVIQTNGGSLALGDLNSNTGFDFGGKLDVGDNQVTLLDKDKANLGVSTNIADGGKLSTINGADLSSGETLNYTGNASILGNFTNNGQVGGTGGTLTFLNDVNGGGGFSGDIAFQGAYKPGNSPAAIDFHGGNVSFNSTTVLTMEIFGNSPGSEYDQLLNIDHLDFNGTLALVFGSNFTPTAGSSFNLFNFSSFSGSFNPDRISVAGIDRKLLDFSNLAVNGSLRVAAVPLPTTAWLFLGGLLGILAKSRRNILHRAELS
ncbi:hypothetical protein [Methylomonas sp. DH-1]|uniref:beta strand repeat-containing protein n=1 Tax=Methylomonas sp. (strain DH-1) TaxID=1727196 RepID=UPI0007C94DEE|nr:hypothetical protein [Methylomonas sp. DH-1]ANE57144.1 hypothetical protein AYM39_19485 [Methylomonas sp. DH-1]